MFNFQEPDFLMNSQCHLLVNFKCTDTVDHKGKTKEKRQRSFCHLLNGYFRKVLR